ncbi:MAG: DUF4124 domain-containing protein [Azoarcus sp.]|jgi:hypothetical protein|nr:DUF4124 domain-containing protein [Azoarcus sp.]
MKTILLILSLCLSCVAAAGSVYRWTDEQGQVHYSDAPPAGVKAKPVETGNITIIPTPPAFTPEALAANRQAYRQAREERKLAELQAQLEEERAARREAERKTALREACQRQHAAPCNDEGAPLEPVVRTVITHGTWFPPHAHRPPHRPRPGGHRPRPPKPPLHTEQPRRPSTSVSIRRHSAPLPEK